MGCGCQDTSLTTIPVPINCPTGNPCSEMVSSNCIQKSRLNVDIASLNLGLLAPYNIPDILGVTFNGASFGNVPVTITFPSKTQMQPNVIVEFAIKDEAFYANVNNIILVPGAGTLIEGSSANKIMTVIGQAFCFYYDGNGNYFIKSANP